MSQIYFQLMFPRCSIVRWAGGYSLSLFTSPLTPMVPHCEPPATLTTNDILKTLQHLRSSTTINIKSN